MAWSVLACKTGPCFGALSTRGAGLGRRRDSGDARDQPVILDQASLTPPSRIQPNVFGQLAYSISSWSERELSSPRPTVNWLDASSMARPIEGACHHPLDAPSNRPALPGLLMGVYGNKSGQGRADAQRLVATRLLERLHDPLGHFSRLQRIYPHAR